MIPRQIIPDLFACLTSYLYGSSLTRLHLLVILLIKPLLALLVTVFLLFIVSHSADICRSLLAVAAFWFFWSPASISRRRFPWRIESDIASPAPPLVRRLFQRPPPSPSL